MIKIISDSSTLYSVEEGKKKNIDITPLSITINNKSYVENEEITTEELIDIINEGHMPSSSQPAVGQVIELYNQYKEDEIIHITMADGLSGTYNSACMAKNMVDNSDSIEIINSRTLCAPQRYLVNVTMELVNSGKTKEEIISEINTLIETSKSFLIPKDFDYLVRGGRLSSLMGKIAGVIKLVPVVSLADDSKSLVKFTTARTLKKAVDKICETLIENNINEEHKIYISHACAEETANDIKNIIAEKIKNADIELYKLGPVFTTQGGPGCVAIQTIKKYNK